MSRLIKGVSLIFAVTTLLMFLCGFFSLGTFPLLAIDSLLATSFVVTALAWLIYSIIGFAVCAPLRVKQPGLALPTVLGTISGAAAIALTGWLIFPSFVVSSGWLAALPFAFVNTLAVWGAAFVTGFVGSNQTFWPTFQPTIRRR